MSSFMSSAAPGTGVPRHSVSVAAVIVDDDGRILAVRRCDNSHWEPPGGILELGEDIECALRREVEEETGYQVEPVTLTGVYKNMKLGVVALVFLCRISGGAASTGAETSHLCWMSPGEVQANMDEAYAVRILDALAGGSPAVRAHDGRVLLHT